MEKEGQFENIIVSLFPHILFEDICVFRNTNMVRTVKRVMGCIGCVFSNVQISQFQTVTTRMVVNGCDAEIRIFEVTERGDN